MKTLFLPLLLSITGLLISARAQGDTWAEEAGKGSINGKTFPIAVIRNAGSEEKFIETLKKRFGSRYNIMRLPAGPFGYGSQFLIKPFTDDQLQTLPIRTGGNDQGALEIFVLEHSMTFSLFDIGGEMFAIGSPLTALISAMPEPLGPNSAFPFLQPAVREAIELSFQFGPVEVTSVSGQLKISRQETALITREAFTASGMHTPNQANEGASLFIENPKQPYQEFFTDGKSQAANVIINDHGRTQSGPNEVTINVNRVHIKTQSR